MLQHWLLPNAVPPLAKASFQAHQLGASILPISLEAPQWTVGSIALLGWGSPAIYSAVRQELATLTAPASCPPLLDVGVVHPDALPLTELLEMLLQHGVFPIVLSPTADVVEAQLRALERRQDAMQLSLIDAHIPYRQVGQAGLLERLWAKPSLLEHTICIGSQAYLLDPAAVEALQQQHGELHRLGQLRHRIDLVEPLIRQADVAAFSLEAIRAADAPAQTYPNPNGWMAEEACQILRYLGMSDQLTSLSLYGLGTSIANHQQTAILIAQLVWFAINGYQARLHELPLDTAALTAYVVDNKNLDAAWTFYKSPRSDRWWFRIPAQLSPKEAWVACAYQDYQLACEGDLTDRLLLALRRLT